jgi:glucose-6-phosphate 1-dehydrogenase
MVLQPVDMRLNYRESFATPSAEAYVTLLSDVINNDATLFMRADQVEAAWRLLMPVARCVGRQSSQTIFRTTPAALGGQTPRKACWFTRGTGGRPQWNWRHAPNEKAHDAAQRHSDIGVSKLPKE